MNGIYYLEEICVLNNTSKFKVGDLITTLLQEYGIIVGFGKHPDHEKHNTEYCYVLIDNQVYNYLASSIKKVKKVFDNID